MMAENARGKRDGTGPFKGSAQRKVSSVGKRGGNQCPPSVKKTAKGKK